MISADDLDAFAPDVDALARAIARRNRGATRGRLTPAADEVRVVNAGEFFWRWCMEMAPVMIAMAAELDGHRQRAQEAMGVYTKDGKRDGEP